MHSEELDNKCCLCVGDIREDTEKYNLNNVWINIYLVEHITYTPNFAFEDKAMLKIILLLQELSTLWQNLMMKK